MDTSRGGVGCTPGETGSWAPGSYGAVPNSARPGATHPQETLLTGFTVVLRSSEDPFITAQAVTKGTMTFGATTAEQLNSSITFLTLGLGLMVVAPWFIFDPKAIKRSC